jgi:hypothetical protein
MQNNKVEILRAICFTKEEMLNISNLGDSFTELDIDFMVEFKKIYELGLNQLEKFINKLDKEGKDLDTYSIMYYVDILNNGPLGAYVRKLSKDKNYFSQTPDSIGSLGNNSYTTSNNTLYADAPYQLGCSVDVYNRLPLFMQKNLNVAIAETENIFRTSIYSSNIIDNTLPIIDKNPQLRYEEESKGKWVNRANGSYMVKDSQYYLIINEISQSIFEKVKTQLGEENFRIYKDKKQYNSFDSEKNTSTSTINKIDKIIKENDKTLSVTTDLLGDRFDSEDRRNSVLKISSDEKDIEYKLHTNKGQLGS